MPLGPTLRGGAKLSFRHFVLQAEIVHAYRKAVRSTRPLPDPQSRRETLNFLRSELERLRLATDIDQIQQSLSDFQRTIKIMVPQFGLTGLGEDAQGAKLVGRGRRDVANARRP